MNGFTFSFAKEIPIERFHNTKVIAGLKDSNNIIVGDAKVDLESQIISIYNEHSSWHIEFEEISMLRWPASGLVHDYWNEERGELVHVPENGEWTTYGYK